MGMAAKYVSALRFRNRLSRLFRRLAGRERISTMDARVDIYADFWLQAIEAEGYTVDSLAPGKWEVRSRGRYVTRICNYFAELDDPATLVIAGDKPVAYELMRARDVTIPPYALFDMSNLGRVREFIESYEPPYVVKPARETSGAWGVSTFLYTTADCLRAAALALSYSEDAIIERHVAGESYRLLYLGCELLAISRRTGLRVTADGRSTVAALLESQCSEELHLLGGRGAWRGDRDVRHTLGAQGLDLDSVPPEGANVLVRSSKTRAGRHEETRTTYDTDVTDGVCAEIVMEGRRAALAVRSEFCGVDVLTVDASRSLASSGGVVGEVNTTPGLEHHYGLVGGASREGPARAVLRYLAAKPSRVPAQILDPQLLAEVDSSKRRLTS